MIDQDTVGRPTEERQHDRPPRPRSAILHRVTGANLHFPTLEDAPALVGDIAEAPSLLGKGVFVGSRFRGKAPFRGASQPGGHLFLGFNDGAVDCDREGINSWGFGGDNHGAFTVIIDRPCRQQ